MRIAAVVVGGGCGLTDGTLDAFAECVTDDGDVVVVVVVTSSTANTFWTDVVDDVAFICCMAVFVVGVAADGVGDPMLSVTS